MSPVVGGEMIKQYRSENRVSGELKILVLRTGRQMSDYGSRLFITRVLCSTLHQNDRPHGHTSFQVRLDLNTLRSPFLKVKKHRSQTVNHNFRHNSDTKLPESKAHSARRLGLSQD